MKEDAQALRHAGAPDRFPARWKKLSSLWRNVPLRRTVTPDCSVLVLGSLPGDDSLRQAQYYAHPRNAFWKIMGSLLGFDSLPAVWGTPVACSTGAGVGLWDVVASGVRPGSLDQHIPAGTAQ